MAVLAHGRTRQWTHFWNPSGRLRRSRVRRRRVIAIIGAGPAGIALGTALDRKNTTYTIFEQDRVGSTWRSVPRDLKVLSPWWTNVLTARDLLRQSPLSKVPSETYLRHLERTAARLKGKVVEWTKVTGLHRLPDGQWELYTNGLVHGPFRAVVVATGYFSNPSRPSPDFESDGSLVVMHAAEIRTYDSLASLRKGDLPVIVVGRRVTAGQTILALNDRNIPAALSIRSSIQFRRHGVLAWLREMAYYVWEEIEAALNPGLRRNSYPVMEGGRNRKLVEAGTVALLPPISRIHVGTVEFADGTSKKAAAVVLATGYALSLALDGFDPHLDAGGAPETDRFEVTSMPGVFLLGVDNLHDHRSRYLRGIRLDAKRLARRLIQLSGDASMQP
ncbi:hypothetical protein CO641_00490 [Lysobacteraceae bacterium NML91-0213]|nr:hypothetical protein CO641_00490 [Xanthomonadaceae bacterium NML91-0213]